MRHQTLAVFLLTAGTAFGQCRLYTHSALLDIDRSKAGSISSVLFSVTINGTYAYLAGNATGNKICISDLANTTNYLFDANQFAYNDSTGALTAVFGPVTLRASDKATDSQFLLWYGGGAAVATGNIYDASTLTMYHFGNGSVSTADATGNGNTATNHSMTSAAAGAVLSGVQGASSGVYLDALGSPSAQAARTVQFWYQSPTNAVAPATEVIMFQGVSTTHNRFFLYINSGAKVLTFDPVGVTCAGTAIIRDGALHQITVTYDGTNTLKSYVDGSGTADISCAPTLATTATPFYLMTSNAGASADAPGILDEVSFHNVVRSASWITATYNNLHAPTTFLSLTNRSTGSAPTLSNVTYTNLSAYSAVFTWTASSNSDSQIFCGLSGGAAGTYASYQTQISDPVQPGTSDYFGVTSHRLGINLPAGYNGHCILQSTNQAGGTASSSDLAVTTPAAPVTTPIGITSVSARTNLTSGASGTSGDINFQTASADGNWVQQGNDQYGRAISGSQYCCDNHLAIMKVATQTSQPVMQLGQDGSTPGSQIHNGLGFQNDTTASSPYWPITSGTCASNVATVNFNSTGFTLPVGTPIWVASALPSGYQVSNVAITASTATSVSYTGTCGSSPWTSAGQVAFWNDSTNHFLSYGIESVNGKITILVGRQGSTLGNVFRISSTDYFAHSWNNGNNGPTPTTTANIDVPLPSTPNFFTAGSKYYPFPLQPCRDYGGANQNSFPCTWIGGTENFIYYTVMTTQATSGYYLFRAAYADDKLMDGTRWQAYNCAAANDDRGLYNNCWSSTLASGTLLNSGLATYGNSWSIVTANDFNAFLLTNWTALPGSLPAGNVSQSAGATLYDLGAWPWGTATAIGSVNRDETDIGASPNFGYYPTWSFLVPGTYTTYNTSPISATVQLRQSGSYLGSSQVPSTNKYGPNLYTIALAPRWTGAKGYGGPRFSYTGSKPGSFISNGLDLLYTFQDPSGTQTITDSSPGAAYTATVAQTSIQLVDRRGLFSPGFPTNGTYGGASTPPYAFFVTTPYVAQSTDFTLGVVFSHQNTASTGPVTGECVINRASLKICRNTTTANSWLVTVGATATSALSVTCDAGTFCGIVITRAAGAVSVYKTDGIQPNTFPLTTLATFTDATALASDALIVGAKSDGTLQFQGWLSLLAIYSRALADNELQQFTGALRSYESSRGITLP